ncbi:glutaminyl-peptide cyclotransferase [Saccharomonospora sp. CUA-673]|uniref:glutaminyl-peptide cyclotransferase n=1 Tax=Saccharomonospora sp. CUA-673 TaxID=1904969 RepID=UPI0011154869|nr:glutaminyl-peptide cyclotransferase [Saccharomonospora sp. CUA-673]
MKTQGMTVADGTFIYSTSYGRTNRSNIYTVDEGATEIDPTARCYRAPSMTQGITDHNGRLYVLNESGAAKFADPPPRNDVRHVHEADVADAVDF